METLAYIDVEVIRTSKAAILVYDGSKEVWIPKRQIHDDSEVFGDNPEDGELVIPAWLAEEKGLI